MRETRAGLRRTGMAKKGRLGSGRIGRLRYIGKGKVYSVRSGQVFEGMGRVDSLRYKLLNL